MSEAVVVGSGPNGLACAAVLARAGMGVTVVEAHERIGGGTRTSELTVPGVLHDHCSAVHPLGTASPVFERLGLAAHGLEWLWPEVDVAHPLDDGSAGAAVRSIDQTAAMLGEDGRAWMRLFGRTSAGFDDLRHEVLRPVTHAPRHPVLLARFGLPALMPASGLAGLFRGEAARALFGGIAAHAFSPLTWPLSSAAAMVLVSAGHRHGWPVARGGSRAITDALASVIEGEGGKIETGRRVRDLGELGAPDAVVLDLSPAGVIEVSGDRLPERVRRAYGRFRYGPGAFKLDLAVEGGAPWRDEFSGKAGTVHVVGSLAEAVAAERDVNRGRMPKRPYVLVAQQYLADPSRSSGDIHPVWAYAHVPAGYGGDATGAVLDQIERFAPGLRERIVATATRGPAGFEAYNSNWVGGDIAAGASSGFQAVFRPRVTARPYETGIPGVFICSSSTPPGGGVHGMCGANAADAVLARLAGGEGKGT